MVKAGALRPALKAIVCALAVLVRITSVPTFTAPLNVVPPELLTVRFFKLVVEPMAPATVINPLVPAFRVSDSVLAVVPLIAEPKAILPAPLAIVVSAVKVTAPT
ncbi:hypothetical protein POBR111598_10010 [Polynucleobacter brandtiae]